MATKIGTFVVEASYLRDRFDCVIWLHKGRYFVTVATTHNKWNTGRKITSYEAISAAYTLIQEINGH